MTQQSLKCNFYDLQPGIYQLLEMGGKQCFFIVISNDAKTITWYWLLNDFQPRQAFKITNNNCNNRAQPSDYATYRKIC